MKKYLKKYFMYFNSTEKEVTEFGILVGIVLLPTIILLCILFAPCYYLAKWLNQ
jgi:hypothetical protein